MLSKLSDKRLMSRRADHHFECRPGLSLCTDHALPRRSEIRAPHARQCDAAIDFGRADGVGNRRRRLQKMETPQILAEYAAKFPYIQIIRRDDRAAFANSAVE